MPDVPVPQLTALLVVRAWLHGEPPSVAARITYTLDPRQPERVEVAASSADEVCSVVRSWLADVEARGESVTGP